MSEAVENEQPDSASVSEKSAEDIEPQGSVTDDRDARIDELTREAQASAEAYSLVLAKYRDALLAGAPELPPELVKGETAEELEASAEAARRIVTQVRERMGAAQDTTQARGFPSGAPGRVEVDTSGLSPGEKIRRGLEVRARGR
ncbi:MAG: hypothetical protein AB7L91_11145 [Dehalococcoidia bacterium]